MIDRRAIVRPTADQAYVTLGDEAILLHTKSRDYFGLTGVAGRIWELIQQRSSVSEIVAALLSEYDVTPDDCERDVERLLSQLTSAGLITIVAADDTPTR